MAHFRGDVLGDQGRRRGVFDVFDGNARSALAQHEPGVGRFNDRQFRDDKIDPAQLRQNVAVYTQVAGILANTREPFKPAE